VYTTEVVGTVYNKKSTSNMKSLLTTNWTFLRALRLGIGVAFLVSAYMQMEIIPAFIGGIFLYQSILNIGCAGGTCYAPQVKQNTKSSIEDVEFEEVK
jgi:hypothetical protein